MSKDVLSDGRIVRNACAVNSVEGGIAQVSVDGMNFKALQTYKVQSPLFSFTFPKDNIFGAAAGPTQSVSEGIFLMMQPLPPGNTVHFTGVVLANPTLGTQFYDRRNIPFNSKMILDNNEI